MNTKAHLTDIQTDMERRNRALAYEAATEGIVLLENNGVLPLSPGRIALYGAGAQYTIKGGSGSGEVNVRHAVSIYEGLQEAGFTIVTEDWLARYDRLWKAGKERFLHVQRLKLLRPSRHIFAELMSADYCYPAGDRITAQEAEECHSDTCIYVLARQSGEGHDRTDAPGSFRLDSVEEDNIRLCATHFKRFVLVINSGAPIDLTPLDSISGIDAVVYMGQLGMEGGHALAAMLKGEFSPSGKLAVTWPQRYSDVPWGEEFGQDASKALYKEGIYVGYRYYDSFDVAPRYPFGYGLSYTTFSIASEKPKIEKEVVQCTIRVANTGKYTGKQTVQLYVRCPGEDREHQRLVAYGKTDCLAPGATQTIELCFSVRSLARYDEAKAQTLLDAGKYLVLVGTSSRETEPAAVIAIPEQMIVCQHRNLCAAGRPVAELHHSNTFDIPSSLPELTVQPDAITPESIVYAEPQENVSARTMSAMQDLSVEDWLYFCAGTGYMGDKRGFCTPGSVGHTTAEFMDKGIPAVEMCDGPAGIRLDRRAVLYPNGSIKPVDAPISIYELLPSCLLHWFILGNPAKGQMLYQFVTGFPIEATLAQTWNLSLLERVGTAVSEEMSEYGVTFWLAPALNIVRNPLCGRNFEYYSEDPLLSGQMAAATTKGVQATKGKYVTLKHFSSNNQESYRQVISSEMDERTLREIYWKGFEIAVKESHPRAVMAAYNKLNGIYCANSHELCTDLLRTEWGFDGLVMTDWYSTGKDYADEADCLRAGVDIIMPGGNGVVRTLRKAYRNGRLDEHTIQKAASRMLEAILNA